MPRYALALAKRPSIHRQDFHRRHDAERLAADDYSVPFVWDRIGQKTARHIQDLASEKSYSRRDRRIFDSSIVCRVCYRTALDRCVRTHASK